MKLYVEKLNLEFSGKEILNDISFGLTSNLVTLL